MEVKVWQNFNLTIRKLQIQIIFLSGFVLSIVPWEILSPLNTLFWTDEKSDSVHEWGKTGLTMVIFVVLKTNLLDPVSLVFSTVYRNDKDLQMTSDLYVEKQGS